MPEVVMYKGQRITYDLTGLSLVHFIDRNTGEECVLVNAPPTAYDEEEDENYSAIYLEELKTVQVMEFSSPTNFKQFESSSEDRERVAIITRVAADEKDKIRAVFSDISDEIPVFVASYQSNIYNSLDVGTVLEISPGGRHRTVHPRIGRRLSEELLFKKHEEDIKKREEYLEILRYGKEAYVERFLKGNLKEIYLDIFTVRGKTLYYTDTEILVPKKEDLARLLRVLASRDVDNLTDVAMNREGGEADNLFDKIFYDIVLQAHTVIINGVKVRYSTKTRTYDRTKVNDDTGVEETVSGEIVTAYINDRRIVWDDLETVIVSASCHPHNQAGYDEYVKSVSKVSLKYHRAMLQGIQFRDSAAYHEAKVAGMLPNDYGDYGNKKEGAKALIPFRKHHGGKAEINFLGKWRAVKSFDALVHSLGSVKRMIKSRVIRDHAEQLNNRSVLERISYIDTFLEEDDRVLINGTHITEYPEDARGPVKNYGGRVTKFASRGEFMLEAYEELAKIVEEYIKLFGDSLRQQHEVLKRSKEFFDRIIEQEKVEVNETGNEFFVTGSSGKRYKVMRNGSVTDMSTGRHICIVNGGTRELGGWDYLASLIAALAHDNRTAQSVHTLTR